ncbi:MAG: hypothetical protein WA364_28790 [Candidatus Nitrosopolaris sp.]
MSILGELMPVYTLKPGTKPPDEVNVVVEILKRVKLDLALLLFIHTGSVKGIKLLG